MDASPKTGAFGVENPGSQTEEVPPIADFPRPQWALVLFGGEPAIGTDWPPRLNIDRPLDALTFSYPTGDPKSLLPACPRGPDKSRRCNNFGLWVIQEMW